MGTISPPSLYVTVVNDRSDSLDHKIVRNEPETRQKRDFERVRNETETKQKRDYPLNQKLLESLKEKENRDRE